MRKWLFCSFVILVGCQESQPNFTHISIEESSINNTPTLDVLLQENALSIQIKQEGTTLYDTTYLLDELENTALFKELENMGAKIYSQETPEWKTRNTTRFADSMYIKSSQLAQLLKKYDKYYDELYYSFSEAAKAVSSRSKEADAKIVHDAEQLDTLKAD